MSRLVWAGLTIMLLGLGLWFLNLISSDAALWFDAAGVVVALIGALKMTFQRPPKDKTDKK